MSHAGDPDFLNRLKRAEGHLATVIAMVQGGRDGLVIAQQMQAVIKALENAKKMLILDHIDHHLGEVTGPLPPELQKKIAAFRDITKYL
jgi:DNA-binding FrmR family transcriptional regulator